MILINEGRKNQNMLERHFEMKLKSLIEHLHLSNVSKILDSFDFLCRYSLNRVISFNGFRFLKRQLYRF